MAEDQDFKRMDSESDPDRCQANGSRGQCMLKGVLLPTGERAKYCPIHGGIGILDQFKREKLRNYQLTQFRAEVERHSDSSNIKSLTEELGILRMLLEQRLNSCKDNIDLLANSEAISILVDRISTLVEKCQKLDVALGQIIDKKVLSLYIEAIIGIIDEEVEDQDAKGRIADRLMTLLEQNLKLEVKT